MTKNAVCPLCSPTSRFAPQCILWPVLSDLHTASEFSGTSEKAACNTYWESFYPQLQYLAFLPKMQGTATEISHSCGDRWCDGDLLEHAEKW